MTRVGLSHRLAQAVCTIDHQLAGARAIECAKERVFDALGVIYAGLDHPASRVALASRAAADGPCAIIGRRLSASADDASFINGVTSHTTLLEDFGGGGHPGTYIVPVALAAGEQHDRSGMEVLVAIIAGYEVADRMQRAAADALFARGFRIVPTIGVFGATATAGMLMKLTPAELGAAFDLAANMACGLYQGFADGTMEGYFQAGVTARSGMLAARLARGGAVTSATALEGEYGFFRTFGGADAHSDPLSPPIDQRLAIVRAQSKPFPACALNQDTMLMIRALRPTRLAEAQVDEIVLSRPTTGINSLAAPGVSIEPPFQNMLQAQMSAKFTAIATLLSRPVESASFFRDSFADPEIDRLARRMRFAVSEDEHPALDVKLRSGERITMTTEQVSDMSWAQQHVCERFETLAAPYLKDKVPLVRDAVLALHDARGIHELMALVR